MQKYENFWKKVYILFYNKSLSYSYAKDIVYFPRLYFKLIRTGYESIIVDDNGAEKELNYDQMAIYPFFRYIMNSEENSELGVLMAEE